ncbi:isochorismatase family protein [Amycolatopsis sp. EV170708-02-1]|nr:isochorismatase family protein [Amycolatopsis sp. EV170708-02-1]
MPAEHELPENTARWTLDPSRAALLIHDLQHYFLRPFGEPLLTDLLRNVEALRNRCARTGVPAYYTLQPGSMTPRQRGLLADFWGPGMRSSPEDRRVPGRLAPGQGDTVFTKWKASAFVRTDLLRTLERSGRDQLLVCGVYGHVGILMTANDAFANDVQTFLAGDAIADFSLEHHRMTLDYAAKRCAVVESTRTILSTLAAATAAAR